MSAALRPAPESDERPGMFRRCDAQLTIEDDDGRAERLTTELDPDRTRHHITGPPAVADPEPRQLEDPQRRNRLDLMQRMDSGDAAEAAALQDPEVASSAEEAAADAVPKDKAQRNFTDPDSRIMKTSDRSFHQCYNAQAIVDERHQIIVASQLTNQAADTPALPGMLEQLQANLGRLPVQLLADAGYFSDDNVTHCADVGVDALIATGRFKHNDPPPVAPRGPIPKDATAKQRMARKLATKPGRAGYARRKAIVEPVFGQMHTRQNAGQVRLRGLDNAAGEHRLHAMVHNLLKIFTANVQIAPA